MSNYKKIPRNKEVCINNVIIEEVSDKFVDLLEYPQIFSFESYYLNKKISGATEHFYVREQVFDRLIEASKYLPRGYKIHIFDAWRPLLVQMELFERQYKKIEKENPSFHEGALINETLKYVSSASTTKEKPYTHSTGGSVDLTIVDDCGHKLDMGTDFDFFSPFSATNHFEGIFKNKIVRENRRFLYDLMTSVGFTNLPTEWWHYDFGNLNWAYYKKKPAIYTGVFYEKDIEIIKKKI